VTEQQLGAVDVADPVDARISTPYLTCENTTNVGLSKRSTTIRDRFWGYLGLRPVLTVRRARPL